MASSINFRDLTLLTCIVMVGSFVPDIVWINPQGHEITAESHDNPVVMFNSTLSTSSLQINISSLTFVGIYTCQARVLVEENFTVTNMDEVIVTTSCKS